MLGCKFMCACLLAGQSLVCMLLLNNTGNTGLHMIAVPDQPLCANLTAISPGASISCNVSKVASQADFDTWDLTAGSANAAFGMFNMSVLVTAKPTAAYIAAQGLSSTGAVSVALESKPAFAVLNAGLLGADVNRTAKAGTLCCSHDALALSKHATVTVRHI
jgi:hypothetical protein